MDYFKKIDTPAGTLEADPKITILELTRGRLLSGELIFSADCNYDLHVTFYLSTFRLAPFNRDSNYVGDDCKVNIFFDQDMHKQPHRLGILTWNVSDQASLCCLLCIHFDPFGLPRTNKTFEELSKELTPGYKKGTERNAPPIAIAEPFRT
jgi:hypothetical protein